MSYDISMVIGKYVQLRDQAATIAERHKIELAGINQQMEAIEGWLLGTLNELGVENVRTESGTAYKSTTVTTKVVDWPQVELLILNGEPQLMIHGVNKTAAVEYCEEFGKLPGVEMGAIVKVNVRRA
jgi:hypothetical protein